MKTCSNCQSTKTTPDGKWCADCLEPHPVLREKKVVKVQLGTLVPIESVLFKIEKMTVSTPYGTRNEIEEIEYCYYEVET